MYTAIQSLTDLQKDILRMSFSEGLKNAEIAQRLGIAEITVKKHKARLLAVLRGKLDDIPSALIIWILCDGIA